MPAVGAASELPLLCRLIAVRCVPLISVVGLSMAAPAHAEMIQVSAGAVEIAADGICSLSEAIISANTNTASAGPAGECKAGDDLTGGGDTIVLPVAGFSLGFAAGADSETLFPPLTSKIDIEGNFATLGSPSQQHRLLRVTPTGVVTFRNLTLTAAGNQSLSGGNLLNEGTADLQNCTLIGTFAASGGGIFNQGTLTVANSLFQGNHGDVLGGGGLAQSSGSATITDSKFISNHASGGGGGALTINGGSVTLVRSIVSGNLGAPRGGAIAVSGPGSITVVNSTIANNQSPYNAGIYSRQPNSVVDLRNTTIAGNMEVGGTFPEGAGLWVEGSISAVNTIIAGNIETTTGTTQNCNTLGATGSNNLADDASCAGGGTFTQSPGLNLGTLDYNGGPTQTIALGAGSSAIGAGDVTTCTNAPVNSLDQRSFPRDATHCDVGAYQSGLDETPDAFSFPAETNIRPHIYVHGGETFPTGFVAAGISISGDPFARYSINGAPFTASPGTIFPGDRLLLRQVSAPTDGASVDAIVKIGSVSETYTVTTGPYTSPKPFTFTDATGLQIHAYARSNYIKVNGISAPASISVTGDPSARFSVNGGAFTNTATTVNQGDRVRLRVITSTVPGVVSATLDIGGVTGTFNATSVNGTTPNPFSFVNQTNVPKNTFISSNTVTISGIFVPVPVTFFGGIVAVSVNGGGNTTNPPNLQAGDTLSVVIVSSAASSGQASGYVKVGDFQSPTWTVTSSP
jgi:hypothetical protein